MADNDVRAKIIIEDEETKKIAKVSTSMQKALGGVETATKKSDKAADQYQKNLKQVGLQSLRVSEAVGKLGIAFVGVAVAFKAAQSVTRYFSDLTKNTLEAAKAQKELTGEISSGAQAIFDYNEKIEATKNNIGQLIIDTGILESWKKLELTIASIAENAVRGFAYMLGISQEGKFDKLAGQIRDLNNEIAYNQKLLAQRPGDAGLISAIETQTAKLKELTSAQSAIVQNYKPEGSQTPKTKSQLAAKGSSSSGYKGESVDALTAKLKGTFDTMNKMNEQAFNVAEELWKKQVTARQKQVELDNQSAEMRVKNLEDIKNLETYHLKSIDKLKEELAENERQRIKDEAAARVANSIQFANTTMNTIAMIAEATEADAVAKKRIAQVQAVINTAVAITSALKTPWLVPLIAMQGAAQIALIERQQFAMGGKPRRGSALVGEQGPEVVTFGDNGARVHNSTESKEMNASQGGPITINVTATTGAIVEDIRSLLRSGEGRGLLKDIRRYS